MKINICCGKTNFGNDWIHIDGNYYDHIDYRNITKLKFDDNSCDLLYCAHGIEYFDREEVVPILKEWIRVLKPEGILRIAVPDFSVMASLYLTKKYSLKSFTGMLYGKMSMGDSTIYHKTCYDEASLTKLLLDVGLTNIRKWDWKEMRDQGFPDDCSRAHLPHDEKAIKKGEFNHHRLVSLNLEGIKV